MSQFAWIPNREQYLTLRRNAGKGQVSLITPSQSLYSSTVGRRLLFFGVGGAYIILIIRDGANTPEIFSYPGWSDAWRDVRVAAYELKAETSDRGLFS